MPLPSLQREYRMTDAELIAFANYVIMLMTRDINKFEDWGVNSNDITNLQNKKHEFEVFPQDKSLRMQYSIASEEKNNVRNTLQLAAKDIADRVVVKWGANSSRYKTLEISDISHLSDMALLHNSRNLQQFAIDNLAEMADVGMTQAKIDVLAANNTNFETKLSAIRNAIALRDEKTRERKMLANELYRLVSKYCEIGKMIWADTNGTYYNHYIIYTKTIELPSKVQDLNYDVAITTIHWSVTSRANTYQLEMKRNKAGFNWITVYEGESNEFIYNPDPGNWLFRCRGKNENGSGLWSAELSIEQLK